MPNFLGSSSTSIGRTLVAQFSENPTLNECFRAELKTRTKNIYTILDSKCFDEQQLLKLEKNYVLLTNVFRTYTHSSQSKLGDIQKLKLMHAFQDISNDIKLRLLEENKQKKESEKNQGRSEWSWGQTYKVTAYTQDWWYGNTNDISEDSIIEGINQFQESMKNPELEVSLSKIKERVASKLKELAKPEEAKEVEILDLVDFKDFQELVTVIANIHDQKSDAAQNILEELSKLAFSKAYEYLVETSYSVATTASDAAGGIAETATSIVSNVTGKIHESTVEYKDKKIREAVHPLKPENIFEGQTLKQLMEGIVDEAVKNNISEMKFVRKIVLSQTESHHRNLLSNMEIITEDKNLARLGTNFNKTLEAILDAIKNSDAENTEEEFSRHLGIETLTVKEYKKAVHKRATNNIAKLLSKPRSIPSEESNFLGAKLFLILLQGLESIFRRIKDIATKSFMKRYIDPLKTTKKFLPQDTDSIRSLIATMGLEGELEKFDKHSELIEFYLLDNMVQESADIAIEAQQRQLPGEETFEPDEETSTEEAISEFKASAERLAAKIKEFKPEESGGIVQEGVYFFISLLGSASEKQGSGDSIFDFATPAIQEIGPAWKSWLTE